MIRSFCDKCQKEVKGADHAGNKYHLNKIEHPSPVGAGPKELQVCQACRAVWKRAKREALLQAWQDFNAKNAKEKIA